MNTKQLEYFYKMLDSCVTVDQAQSCLKLIAYKNTVTNAKNKDNFMNLQNAFSATRKKIQLLMIIEFDALALSSVSK